MDLSSSSQSKKRKRDSAEQATLSVVKKTDRAGPVLVSFPAVQPPEKTAFQVYRNNKDAAHTVLKGETEAIEYSSTSLVEKDEELGCQYMIGVYDKTTNTVRLHRAPAYVMTRTVKRTKTAPSIVASQAVHMAARNHLGETFGSKKALKAIRAAERNRVDVSAMEGVAGHMQMDIEEGTTSLPSKEEAVAEADSNRPIPPVNTAALTASDVYSVNDIVLPAEMNSIPVAPFLQATTLSERKALLPWKYSNWINSKLDQLFAGNEKPSKTAIRLLFFVACMFAFREAAKKLGFEGNTKEAVEKKLSRVPETIRDGLFARFSELARTGDTPKITTTMESKLLTHMFALCLKLDSYSVVIGPLAGDLHMTPANTTTLFKTLGCTVATMSVADREKARLSMAEAREQKRAVLKIPLVFPVARNGKKRK